jgi:hypothetical protein
MVDILLTQAEGDALLALEKKSAANDSYIDLPDSGSSRSIEINFVSLDGREEFVLNYTRHSINISKRNHHFRGRKVIGLARLDLDGPPHRNPDDQEIGSRHLHLYREGYGLKWAFEVPTDKFTNLDDPLQTLEDFMYFCNIVQFPRINKGLFT